MDELFECSDSLNAPFQAFQGDWKGVRSHWHYFTEVVYLVEGMLMPEVDGRQFTMKPGDMIIIHPKQIHSFLDYPASAENPEKPFFYVIKFDGMILANTTPGSPKLPKLLDRASNTEGAENLLLSVDLRFNPVKMYFEYCIWETQHKQFGYDIKVASMISLIITEVVRIWLRHGFQFSEKQVYNQFSNKDFSVLEYIDAHSAENINIGQLASKCGMCYSNFAKQFKTQFGKTCKEYIEFVRICKADTLLLYTDKTLDYISQEIGFTDASHFIRTYKRIRGITPKQRRNSQV